MQHEFKDQMAVVTGGARGIGRAICLTLAGRGATVVAVDLLADLLATLPDEAASGQLPGRIVTEMMDVTDTDAVEAFFERLVGEHGRVDVLVNNAGITRDGLLMNMDDEQFDLVIKINLRAVFQWTRAASKYMVRARRGAIVNMASVSGLMGNAGQANYAASKAGVVALTKTTAKELGKRGVRCNAVAPGFIATDMTQVLPDKVKENVSKLVPLQGRFGEAQDVADAVVFLASPRAAYITSQVLRVDGGLLM